MQRVPRIEFLREANARSGFVESADFQKLAAACTELWLRAFVELAGTYGWRRGELLGLRVRQINLTNRTVRLNPGETKNDDGRECSLTQKVFELLRECVNGKRSDDFVLTRSNNRPVRDLRDAWWALCIKAGLGKLVCLGCKAELARAVRCKACGGRKHKYSGLIPHDMRRSAAKQLRAAGVPESVVMQIGGWRTAGMFRRYAIVSSADGRAAVEMLERSRAERAAAFAAGAATLEPPEPAAAGRPKPN